MGENAKIPVEDERLNLQSAEKIAGTQADATVLTPTEDARSRMNAAAQQAIAEYSETFRILSK